MLWLQPWAETLGLGYQELDCNEGFLGHSSHQPQLLELDK